MDIAARMELASSNVSEYGYHPASASAVVFVRSDAEKDLGNEFGEYIGEKGIIYKPSEY